ncbi:MAG: DNA photolyase [Pseudomonadota bacterium]
MKFKTDELWIDEDTLAEPLTGEIIKKLPHARVLIGREFAEPRRNLDLSSDPLARGKKIVRLMKHRGAFVKPCPGTPEYVCCGLKILHIGQGCPMDCRYCALQVYFNRPVMEVFVNIEEMLSQLRQFLDSNPSRFHRICTGEFTDSLALDPLTNLSVRLTGFFADVKNASLEIKTKTDLVDPLLATACRGRVVLSFSVNAPSVSKTEERRAAPLFARIHAAARARTKGYMVGFHFDPIIPLPGWEEEYASTIDEIFRQVDPSGVAWISLGVLRFVPRLKEVVTSRFGPIPSFHDAFIRGLDGKSRLHVTRRIGIYRLLADRIRRHAPDAHIYLCMESPSVWEAALGIRMQSDEDLGAYLDEAVR